DELNRIADLVQLYAQIIEHLGGDALTFTYEAEKEVLRADVVVVEALRFLLRQGEHLARSLAKLIESVVLLHSRCLAFLLVWRKGAYQPVRIRSGEPPHQWLPGIRPVW